MEQLGKILIVDDNEDVLFALNLLLEPYTEKIKVATTPDRIEYFMTTFGPDIILLDMNFSRDAISGQEGFESLQQILKIDPQAIVIFMTAYQGRCNRFYSQAMGERETSGNLVFGHETPTVTSRSEYAEGTGGSIERTGRIRERDHR